MRCKLILILLICPHLFSHEMPMQEPRIAGGKEVSIRKFPWQAALEYKGKFICGGSIISHYFIMTAAHCTVKKSSTNMKVRVGTSEVESGGKLYKVMYKRDHPKYDSNEYFNDISLLKLFRSLHFSDFVKPVRLPKRHYYENLLSGKMAWVSGYGVLTTDENDTEFSTTLMATTVPIIPLTECKRYYRKKKFIVDESMICASYPNSGRNSLPGDSGGPLTMNGVQIGIVSWGLPKGPGVYASVSKLRDFIRKIAHI